MWIKPAKGKEIPDPIRGGFLPPEGGQVEDNDIYWQRRIADGDVVQTKVQTSAQKD